MKRERLAVPTCEKGMTYLEIVQRRRDLRLDGDLTLQDVGFDWPWVTPYQKKASSMNGPVLIAYNWLDAPSVRQYRPTLEEYGYLPDIPFNKVLDLALKQCNIDRSDLYITQAFHLLPSRRSQTIAARDVDFSFDAVTRHELLGRTVIALGAAAARACDRHGIRHCPVRHPSARGRPYRERADELAKAIIDTGLLPN
jgi:hypothetical protein